MRWFSWISILVISLLGPVASAQTVWPGDVNNNGVVNGVDLLYWGVAFGSTGPSRATLSTDWEGVPLRSLWTQNFPNGINYAFADCNGNGIVDEDDFDDAIEDNFGLTQGTLRPDGYANTQTATAPRLRLQPSATVVGFGATVNIGLSLDDAAMPISDFYGIALKMSYSTGILEGDDGPDFELAENSWIAAGNGLVQDLFVDNNGQGQADLSITRTNQVTVPVAPGDIGQLSIVIEDIIVGRDIDTFQLQIDSIFLIDKALNVTAAIPDTARIIVAKDPKLVTAVTNPVLPNMQVFPNPTSDHIYVRSNVLLQDIQLVDHLGRATAVPSKRLQNEHYHISIPALPPGLYWLSAKTEQGLIGQKIIIIQP
ncbi:MAG: T9SS type A sorting domain-containing protein [Saprospiraceae bacterium]